jgi:hypothetical protein
MRNKRNKNAPPVGGLVEHFIGSEYDTVKLVSDNIDLVIEVGEAIENGELDDFLSEEDINTLAKLNAIVADAQIASEAYVDMAVTGLYDPKGGYNPATNTPDLTTLPNGVEAGDAYIIEAAGTMYGQVLAGGDQIFANIDEPSDATGWTFVNRNIDETAFATAAQGALADTALQPGGVHNVSELINDANYADDQTQQEITNLYNAEVAMASQAEMEAGIEAAVRRMSPLGVAQAITALAASVGHNHDGLYSQILHQHASLYPDKTNVLELDNTDPFTPDADYEPATKKYVDDNAGGGGGGGLTPVFKTADFTAVAGEKYYVDSSAGPVAVTLPAGVDADNIKIQDVGHSASANNITATPDGAETIDGDVEFVIDQNEGDIDIAYDLANTNWAVSSDGSPDLIDVNFDYPAGFADINAQTGTTYEFVVGDLVEGVSANNVAASTYSVPDSLGQIGNTLTLINIGVGPVTVDMAGTDTLISTDNICETLKAITIVKMTATSWIVIGGSA